jgi:tetratricopeptide (TPR) repeat protein
MRSTVFGLLLAGATLSPLSHAFSADCTMGQLQVSPFSVIEPCTRVLQQSTSDSEKSQAHFVRARGYHRTKRLAEAHADYDDAFRLDPKNAEILVDWSHLDIRMRHMQDYANRVEQAYALDPNNARVLRAVGGMFNTFGDHDRALEFYTKALSVDPSEPYVLYFRALLHRDRNAFKEAIADADALIAVPRATTDNYPYLDAAGTMLDLHAQALVLRAELLAATGERQLARLDFDAAVATERTVRTLYKRGWFLSSIPERRNEALADFEAAVALDPRNDQAQYGLGLVLVGLKRFDDAFRAFDAAVNAHPTGFSLRMRARMHREFKRTDEAARDYEEAIAIDPQERQYAINAMRRAGYWTSRELPDTSSRELSDAVRACMIDMQCN